MKNIILYSIFFLGSFSMMGQKSMDALLKKHNLETVEYITVNELKELQSNEKVILLDSREEQEYKVSHIVSAQCVGYDFFSSEEISEEIIEKDTPIVVYCSVGIRSEDIGEQLKAKGFTNVKNLYGGIFEWKNQGNSVLDSTQTKTENIHTFSKSWSKWLKKGNKIY